MSPSVNSPTASIAILVNPTSGAGFGSRLFRQLKDSSAISAHVFEISELEKTDLSSYSHLLVCGGDGTITSAVARVVATNCRCVVVPIPLGTANDLARELWIRRVTHAGAVFAVLERLSRLTISQLSVWEARWGETSTDRIIFTNYLSLGFDAKVVKDFSHWRMGLKGKRTTVLRNRIQYAFSGLRNLSYRLPAVTVSSRNSAISLQGGVSLLFANIQSIMGFGRTHKVCDFSDGLLEAITLPSIFSFLKLMPPFNSIFRPAELLGRNDSWTVSGKLGDVAMQSDGEMVVIENLEELRITKIGTVKVGGNRPAIGS